MATQDSVKDFKGSHGIRTVSTDCEGCASRAMEVVYDEVRDRYMLSFQTLWVEGGVPAVTNVSISAQGAEMRASSLFTIMHDRDKGKIPEPKGDVT